MSVRKGQRLPRTCLNCGTKVCTHCERPKPPAEFYRSRRATDGLQEECTACHAQRQREYRDRKRRGEAIPKPSEPPKKGVFADPPEKVYSKGERADYVLLIEKLRCKPFYFNLL